MTTKRRSEREPHRVAAAFGARAVDLAESVGKTKQDLIDAARISLSTLNRLVRGEGSVLAAIEVKSVLKGWGADVAVLPPIDSDEDGPTSTGDDDLREGFELLRRLRELANEERFRVGLDRIKDLVRAHELVAVGTDKFPRRKS